MSGAAPRAQIFARIRKILSDSKAVERLLEEDVEVLQAVGQRVGQWRLLHGVPFSHLVADEAMLPPESLRFFHLDRDWVAALLDGACSPGRRLDELGRMLEALVMPEVERSADAWARMLRAGPGDDEPQDDGITEITGFLLRSQAVSGWKSLGVNAYALGSTERLPLLRFERLSEGVLIGLFEGVIHRLDIHEAPQGLHFGVDAGGMKSLRCDREGQPQPVGKPTGQQVGLKWRDAGRRVLDVAALSASMRTELGTPGKGPLPSSDFALQMIEGVGLVSFGFEEEKPHE